LELEFSDAAVVVVGGDEGPDGCAELGEVLVGAAVDDSFREGAVEAFAEAVGLRQAWSFFQLTNI